MSCFCKANLESIYSPADSKLLILYMRRLFRGRLSSGWFSCSAITQGINVWLISMTYLAPARCITHFCLQVFELIPWTVNMMWLMMSQHDQLCHHDNILHVVVTWHLVICALFYTVCDLFLIYNMNNSVLHLTCNSDFEMFC